MRCLSKESTSAAANLGECQLNRVGLGLQDLLGSPFRDKNALYLHACEVNIYTVLLWFWCLNRF